MELKVRAILTGATGMVGEGVLLECLLHPNVESVLVISRKPSGVSHAKLKEIVHPDFFDLSLIENQLYGYNACFFCAGVSSLGMKEQEYTRITFNMTLAFAGILCKLNPDMTFCYVSGAGTDSTEKGKLMWARVKGRTENVLAQQPFKAVYAFRPAFMKPTKGQKNVLPAYKYVGWMYPVMKPIFSGYFGTVRAVGLSMINCVLFGYETRVLEAKDIAVLAKKIPEG